MNSPIYNETVQLIHLYPEINYFGGGCSEQSIARAEALLGIKFRGTYRKFLRDYGAAGSFGGSEIYGIRVDEKGELDDNRLNNVVIQTLDARNDYGLPKHFILISSLGNGEAYYLDSSKEPMPVVVYWSIRPVEGQTYEIETDTFEEFFLSLVKISIEVHIEDAVDHT